MAFRNLSKSAVYDTVLTIQSAIRAHSTFPYTAANRESPSHFDGVVEDAVDVFFCLFSPSCTFVVRFASFGFGSSSEPSQPSWKYLCQPSLESRRIIWPTVFNAVDG
ncbi:hypothetical protein PV326_001761 [Microctonus aethiopoides]|nr:hypothetical protein PV326_001761 [Microctonus aethiopoides]